MHNNGNRDYRSELQRRSLKVQIIRALLLLIFLTFTELKNFNFPLDIVVSLFTLQHR